MYIADILLFPGSLLFGTFGEPRGEYVRHLCRHFVQLRLYRHFQQTEPRQRPCDQFFVGLSGSCCISKSKESAYKPTPVCISNRLRIVDRLEELSLWSELEFRSEVAFPNQRCVFVLQEGSASGPPRRTRPDLNAHDAEQPLISQAAATVAAAVGPNAIRPTPSRLLGAAPASAPVTAGCSRPSSSCA